MKQIIVTVIMMALAFAAGFQIGRVVAITDAINALEQAFPQEGGQ